MAIKIYEQFAPFANPADGDYPQGSFKNDSIPGAEDGTPLDAVWANDYAGTDAELFAQAGIVPNGQPDKLGASQRFDALHNIFDTYGTVAELASGKFQVGKLVALTDRALEVFLVQSGGTPNGSGVLDAGGGNTAVIYNKLLSVNFSFNLKADPISYGVKYGRGMTTTQREDNAGNLQRCFNDADDISVNGFIETYGKIIARGGQTVSGINRSKSGIVGFHPSEPTLTDVTLGRPNAHGNSTQNLVLEKLNLVSYFNDAVYMTPFQSTVELCRIQAPKGAGIRHHDGGYQAENEYSRNEFYGCKNGVLAPGGFRNATDQFFLHNYFYTNGVTERCFDMGIVSGSCFSGNHYYGNNLKEYVSLIAGSNINISDEFFEGNNSNALLRIIGGNPASMLISGCKFWKGDGTGTDWEGDRSSIIKCSINETNPFLLGMSSNNFLEGANSVPIFTFVNGNNANTGGVDISFDRSNVISGSYQLVDNVGGGAVSDTIVQCDHPQFYSFQSTQNYNFYGRTGSEVFQEDTGSATSFPSLPQSVFWLTNKLLIINNVAVTTQLNFSSTGGTLITGLNPVPPNTRVAITRRGANYFIFKY